MNIKLNHLLGVAVSIVFVSWIVIPLLVFRYFGQADSPGSFGDTFGVVNALFSSLAFALLIYTALMQREELELQRKELELTRRELEKSAAAQNMLVSLTKEQLELDKAIRKNQVQPELARKSLNLIKGPGGDRIQINFVVKLNRLRIFKLDMRGEKNYFKINESLNTKTFGRFYEPNDDVFVIIESQTRIDNTPIGLIVDIYFEDIDSRTYRQSYTLATDGDYLSNSQEFSLTNFLLS